MPERPKIPSTEQLIDAEAKRAAGKYNDAREIVSCIRGLNLSKFSRRSPDLQRQFLTAARIYVSSSISSARGQDTAVKVAEELAEAKQVIDTVYGHSEVAAVARQVKAGIDDKPYEFHTEMRRDKILYLLTLAALMGNSGLLGTAIKEMDGAIAEAEESTVRTLLQFERQRLIHRQKPNDESFADLTKAFNAGVNASLRAENYERAATIAARYIIDVERKFPDKDNPPSVLTDANAVYDEAVRGHDTLTDIIDRERVKDSEEPRRYAKWRYTVPKDPKDADYSYLKLR